MFITFYASFYASCFKIIYLRDTYISLIAFIIVKVYRDICYEIFHPFVKSLLYYCCWRKSRTPFPGFWLLRTNAKVAEVRRGNKPRTESDKNKSWINVGSILWRALPTSHDTRSIFLFSLGSEYSSFNPCIKIIVSSEWKVYLSSFLCFLR